MDFIHFYIDEFNRLLSRRDNRYFVTATDDFSRYMYLMKPSISSNAINLVWKTTKNENKVLLMIEIVIFPLVFDS